MEGEDKCTCCNRGEGVGAGGEKTEVRFKDDKDKGETEKKAE